MNSNKVADFVFIRPFTFLIFVRPLPVVGIHRGNSRVTVYPNFVSRWLFLFDVVCGFWARTACGFACESLGWFVGGVGCWVDRWIGGHCALYWKSRLVDTFTRTLFEERSAINLDVSNPTLGPLSGEEPGALAVTDPPMTGPRASPNKQSHDWQPWRHAHAVISYNMELSWDNGVINDVCWSEAFLLFKSLSCIILYNSLPVLNYMLLWEVCICNGNGNCLENHSPMIITITITKYGYHLGMCSCT